MSEETRDDAAAGGRVDRLAAEALNDARQLTEGTAQKLIDAIEHSAPVRHLRGSQVATGVLGTVGFALFVVGVERAADDIPVLSNAWGSIAAGLVLLAVTGLLLRRLIQH